jgi:hypothetical protein
MIKNIQVKIIGSSKSNRSSKKVIESVQRGEAIPRGDIGAYLVGVFACRPLTFDKKNYDLEKKQWSHCIYKEQWTAALYGKDEFTEEQKPLILAGVALLENHTDGWWNKAIAQPHVHKLLESWSNSNQVSSAAYGTQIDIQSNAGEVASLQNTLADINKPKPSDTVAYFDQVIPIIDNQPKLNLYEVGRAWLTNYTIIIESKWKSW